MAKGRTILEYMAKLHLDVAFGKNDKIVTINAYPDDFIEVITIQRVGQLATKQISKEVFPYSKSLYKELREKHNTPYVYTCYGLTNKSSKEIMCDAIRDALEDCKDK